MSLAAGELSPGQLLLQSTVALGEAFAEVAGASVEAEAGGFKITAPAPDAEQQFYRIQF